MSNRDSNVFIERLNIKRVLDIGDLIDVEYINQHIIANSRIIDLDFINHRGRILPPLYKNMRIHSIRGEKINIRIYERASNYMIKSKILNVEKEYLEIFLPRIAYKIQKRLFYRIPIIREGVLKDEENNIISFETRDFSAGGMLIVTKKDIDEEKDYIIENLHIDETLNLKDINVKTVRKIGENIFGEKMYGMKFLNIDYKTEKNIVRYVNLYSIKSKHLIRED